MKKLGFTLLVFIGIAVVMIMTCPGTEEHKAAFKAAAQGVVDEELGSAQQSDLAVLIGGMLGGYMVDNLVDSRLYTENYFVCSVGYLRPLDGSEPQMVTVGLFNHVFAPSSEQIRATIDKQ